MPRVLIDAYHIDDLTGRPLEHALHETHKAMGKTDADVQYEQECLQYARHNALCFSKLGNLHSGKHVFYSFCHSDIADIAEQRAVRIPQDKRDALYKRVENALSALVGDFSFIITDAIEEEGLALPAFAALPAVIARVGKSCPELDTTSVAETLVKVHENGTQLNFDLLARFPDLDFFHDIYEIMEKADPETGKLRDFFSPRCSVPAPAGPIHPA